MMTMGSLFDGIGGFPLAAIHNGIIPVWASEIEAFPIQVTKLRFPQMQHTGDITKLNGKTLPLVDVICRGQSMSGSVGCRTAARACRRTLRLIYGTGSDCKGDEECR